MSDRPMRLKYLTKMKIILCIFLLCITAVSVFGQSVELNGIVGESVKFPAKVETSGILMYGSKANAVIGYVSSGALIANTEYQGRVQWDSSTGYFSLSGLRLEDSGVYTVENNDGQKSVSNFSLTVWKDNVPVSKPNVIFHNEYCTIECTAERGTGVTLSWYREGQTKPYVSSRVASAPHLHLPQTVERSGTYTCEAENSVSNQKASITVAAHCKSPHCPKILAIVLGVIAAVAVLIACFFAYKCRSTRSELERTRSELERTRSELEHKQPFFSFDEHDQVSSQAGIGKEHAVTRSELDVTRSELEGIFMEHAEPMNCE